LDCPVGWNATGGANRLRPSISTRHGPTNPSRQAPPDSRRGTLQIEGEFIQKLTAVTQEGREEEIVTPGPGVVLPVGRYCIRQVDLEGNFSSYQSLPTTAVFGGDGSEPDSFFRMTRRPAEIA